MHNKLDSLTTPKLTYDDISLIPQLSDIASRSCVNVTTNISRRFKIKMPILSAPMDTVTDSEMAIVIGRMGGVGFIHRFMSPKDQVQHAKKAWSKLSMYPSENGLPKPPVAVAVGATDKSFSLGHAKMLSDVGVSILLIDVAHGHHVNVKETIEKIKSDKELDHIDVIAGNVVTSKAIVDLVEWGADGIRVGVGSGSLCTTRIVAATGVPQATAVAECSLAAVNYNIPVIADGGIRYPGDVAKSIALGADTVMLGSLLAGTSAAPGRVQKTGKWPNFQSFKQYRGSASAESKEVRNEKVKHVEGTSKLIPYKGETSSIIEDILDGLRSAMSYSGSDYISEFKEKSRFVRVSQASTVEAMPHLLGNE